MQLSDHEIRDINKYLSGGKPLPEEYRFKLFGEKRQVELVWNGKTDEVTNIILPFQTVETIDEPRSDTNVKYSTGQMGMFDPRGRQLSGWKNKLIWGDNKLILSSLKNGPLRKEIEDNGGIKLIYIDPPFDVGADFSMNIEIGDEEFTKKASVIEEVAYRDTWGKGADSWIAMMYERLSLMKDLLADDGSIYLHCDYRVSSYVRLVFDEIFGKNNFRNEIIWYYSTLGRPEDRFAQKHDTIFCYGNSENTFFNIKESKIPYSNDYIKSHFRDKDDSGKVCRKRLDAGKWRVYYPEDGMIPNDVWEIPYENSMSKDRLNYPTQKPESLLERIIKSSSKESDIVCDFFCGSGTTLATAEKLNRKWIGSDLGKFGIHTTRKRLIGVQRELKTAEKNYRAFEVLNIGKYERQYYAGLNLTLEQKEQELQIQQKNNEYVELILSAYKAEKTSGFKSFDGTKTSRMVAVGPINIPVTSLFVNDCIKESLEKGITKVDILGFEFEMNLAPRVQEEAKQRGIDLSLKYIPREVFDKRAIEKNQVAFYDVSYIEVKPHYNKKSVSIELTDFSVFYNQDNGSEVEELIKNGGSKIIIEKGQIIKKSKNKDGIVTREVLTKKWSDWIDYWSVDFDYQSKKEVMQRKNESGEMETIWTGDYTFENEWQSFRTKKNRELELKSVSFECAEKRSYKIAVKVVDIFGNDTMSVIAISL